MQTEKKLRLCVKSKQYMFSDVSYITLYSILSCLLEKKNGIQTCRVKKPYSATVK